jgi:hypothetical protein
MPRHLLIALACLLAILSRAGADQPAALPVDPAAQREWLAFAWIDLRSFSGDGGKSSPRAAAGAVIEQALLAGRTAVGPLTPDDRTVIAKAIESAVKGSPAAIWLVPETAGDKSALTARVWEDDANHTVLTLHPLANPDATPLQTAAGVLGPAGFAEWPAHRAAIDAAHRPGAGATVFELALNIDAIRHQCTGEFDAATPNPRGQSILNALHVGNARVLGLHARLIPPAEVTMRDPSLPKRADSPTTVYAGPPLLRLDTSWSARSQPPGVVRTRELTSGYWPAVQLGPVPSADSGAFVLAMRTTWRPLLDLLLDGYSATLIGAAQTDFASARLSWKSAHGSAISSLIGGLDPWLVARCPSAADSRGQLAWHIPLRREATAGGAAKLIDELTKDLGPRVAGAGGETGCGSSSADARWAGLGLTWCVDDTAPARVHGTLRFGPRVDM